MIEDVEDLSSQLNPQLLSDVSVFEDREVDVVITRPTQRVSTKRTKMPRAGNTRTRTAVAGRIKRAGTLNAERLMNLIRRAGACIWIADDIRSREKLARVVVIIEQRQVKRIAGADRHDRV